MKYYVTSDLHYGLRKGGDRATRALAEHVNAHPADALILAGDLGKDLETIAACLALFKDFQGPKMAVPGNHDVWTGEGGQPDSSWWVHERGLPALFEAHGFHALHIHPLQIGDVAFVGSMGWYDYSFRDDIGIDLSWYEHKTLPDSPRPLWNDAVYAHFEDDDRALTARLNARLARQLDDTAGASRVVAVVHHLITKALLVHPRERVPHHWRFANAFLGAEGFGDTLRDDARVRAAFCGHIHMARKANLGSCRCVCVGSDYRQKQLLLANPEQVVSDWLF